MKAKQTTKAEFVIKVPYKQLLKMIGVPKDAKVTYIEGDSSNGLIVYFERQRTERRAMGRPCMNYQIEPQVMSSITGKLRRALYMEVKEIAKQKGISSHLFIELALEKAIKEYQENGF